MDGRMAHDAHRPRHISRSNNMKVTLVITSTLDALLYMQPCNEPDESIDGMKVRLENGVSCNSPPI